MSVKYIPNGNIKVVVEGIAYQNSEGKNAVLPEEKISKDELNSLLKRKLIRKLELDEAGTPIDVSRGKRGNHKKSSQDTESEEMESEEMESEEMESENTESQVQV